MDAGIARQSRHEGIVPATWAVVLAASAGGIVALQQLLRAIPEDFAGAILIVQHRSQTGTTLLKRVLRPASKLPVIEAAPLEPIQAGTVYVAPADFHLVIRPDRTFAHCNGTRIRGVLSSANPLLESVAERFGSHAIAVVLTGYGCDATDGVQAVKAAGGTIIAQHPETAFQPSMPLSAIKTGDVDRILPLDEIAPALCALVAKP